MRVSPLLLLGVAAGFLHAQDTPLTVLPYTPSLDTSFMDRSINPCNDFFAFSCGNWNKLNPTPPDQSSWNVYSKLTNENQRFLWGVLDQAAKGGAGRNANEQKIGDLFHACMDETAVEAAGMKPIEPALARIANLNSPNDFASYIGEEHRGGVDGGVIFAFNAEQDYENSSQMIAFAYAAGLGLPDRDYYTKTDAKSIEIRQKYLEHVGRMLQLIGESGPDAQADAKSVMDIETALAKASLTRVESRNPYNLKHKLSRDDFERSVPQFDWDVYLNKLQPPEFQTVNVTEPKFFDEVNSLLAQQKMPAWRAYFRWHLVAAQAPYLASKFVQEDFDFNRKYLAGVPQMQPRWKKCTRLVDRDLGEALGQVFVAKTFSPQTKTDAVKVTREIEAEMGSDIKELNWMSDATKARAIEKLHAIVNKIGYPDKWRDYSLVQITPGDFAGDILHASAFEQHREMEKIGKPVDRGEWDMTPPTVNAYYDPQMNNINFPAGVLQPPLFDPKMDAAPNYGNTGATIGHELTHGFDDEGRQFDAKGDLKDWWTPEDAKAFESRVSCVRSQYAKYVVVDDIHINSSLTLGEDVADIGGTLLAYVAWKHATQNRELKSIDGLTPDQRFFVGMAQWACGYERPESKRMHAITDPHSPGEYRINGVVADLPEFGNAFGCQVGQPMMPAQSCRVW